MNPFPDRSRASTSVCGQCRGRPRRWPRVRPSSGAAGEEWATCCQASQVGGPCLAASVPALGEPGVRAAAGTGHGFLGTQHPSASCPCQPAARARQHLSSPAGRCGRTPGPAQLWTLLGAL